MKLQIDQISFHIAVDEKLLRKKLVPILFLHGFTGSSREWEFLTDKLNNRFIPVAIDLIGHGQTDSPSDTGLYTAASISKQINTILDMLQIDKAIICGYSMGGRAALSFFANYPGKTAGLILESTTPGIEDEQLRNERIKNDELLADKIASEGVEKFSSHWLNLPLFDTLKSIPREEYERIVSLKIRNNPAGLINSLKGFGTGIMPPLWDTLREINFPVLLITGEYDKKFTEINNRLKDKILNSEHIILRDCGHNTHLEKPAEFINLVNKYLSDNFS